MTEPATAEKQYKQSEEVDVWTKYEQRKAELEGKGLSSKEYFDACQKIAEELGI